MARKCLFESLSGGRNRCLSCGLTVDIVGEGVPVAVCGRPNTLRVLHGETASAGVGTHLKRLLANAGVHAGKGCRCGQHAEEMDKNGPDWCDQNVDVIVGWMEEEAKLRSFTFFTRFAARMLVKKAIRLARRDSSGEGSSLPPERQAVAGEVYPTAGARCRLDVYEGPEEQTGQGANTDRGAAEGPLDAGNDYPRSTSRPESHPE